MLDILIIIFVILVFACSFIYFYIHKIFREHKNIERALKIVPLLIHLPPTSDDTEASNRDKRDVDEETISKAQTIYNIIAGTWKKGFNYHFYGQRHFAFEIIGSGGFIYFYAAVPINLLEVVKQSINSAYPTARVEEVAEHNIFNEEGKIEGTLGGELVLKKSHIHPIATYQDLKRDPMQSLLTSMAGLGKEDGAAIQMLMRPANQAWRKQATSYSSKKRKGQDTTHGIESLNWWAKNIVVGLFSPPDPSKEKSGPKELSSLEQNTLDSIDDKTRYPAFEVVIRVVVSSTDSQKAQSILGQVVASFSLFDLPGKNGFKYVPAKDMDSLVSSYIMRFFPPENNHTILNSVELATLFHFPDQENIPTSQLVKQASKQVDGPRNIPDEGLLLGYNVFRGSENPFVWL